MSQLEKAYEKAFPQIRNPVTGLTSSCGVPSKQPTGVLTSSRGEFLKYGIDCSNRRVKVIRTESQILHPLSLEITEMETEIGARGEVPGFGAKHLEIGVTPRRLFILG